MKQYNEFLEAREAMVREQIEYRGIQDRAVLSAIRSVPRHLFVPTSERYRAYEDTPLPIGKGQTISQPYIVAAMTEYLKIDDTSSVLDLGTGSGYQAAVLGEICRDVVTIEIVEVLYRRARRLISQLGYENIECRMGDGSFGAADRAPFDAICLAAAAPRFPEAIAGQLADGGVMVYPEGNPFGYQELIRITKSGDGFDRRRLMGVRFVPMTGAVVRQ